MNNLLATFLLCAATLLAGCSDSTTSDAKAKDAAAPAAVVAFNAMCPVSGDAVDSTIRMVSFKGHEIGFCCARCPPKFEAMTDAQKVAALAEHGDPEGYA